MVYLDDPNPDWANEEDCGTFPCTAPANIVMDFKYSTWLGSEQANLANMENFQIVSDTENVADYFNNCQFEETWNAWSCDNSELGLLVAIADDGDWEDRTVAPVYVYTQDNEYFNTLNSMMDHTWDGFYTGQLRKSQFPIMVQTNEFYTIEYSGTPFNKMRYKLWADNGPIKLRILYWNAGSYSVSVDGEVVEPTEWDKDLGS